MGWPTECPECGGDDLTLAENVTMYTGLVNGELSGSADYESNDNPMSLDGDPIDQPVRLFCACGHYLPQKLWAIELGYVEAPAPECGHSACRQHWIDTGSLECVTECQRCSPEHCECHEAGEKA